MVRLWAILGKPVLLVMVILPEVRAQEITQDSRWSDTMSQEHSLRPPDLVGRHNNAAVAYFRAWDMVTFRE